jgi:uncharacterized phage-like protein YoqJ
MAEYVVAVTGHRDIVVTEALKVTVKHYLKDVVQKYDEVVLLSPLAVGADILVAQIFLNLKEEYPQLRLEVPLPFTLTSYLQNYTKEEEKVFSMLFNEASSSYVVPQTMKQSYQNLGVYLVTHADVLLALWDGTNNALAGGTADVVTYAKSQNKPLKHIPVKRKNS